MEISGASIIIKSLIDQGVDVIFGYPGGAVLPIYDELFKQNKLRHILVRHEQAAVHAAEGYARATGKVGVILVTSGPGATNTITGLADAYLDSIPIVCITGQVASFLIGSDAFQEADTIGITRSCTKHNYMIKKVEDIETILKEAMYIANSGRPGPVVIDFPKDMQNAKYNYKKLSTPERKSYTVKKEGDLDKIKEAVELISKAKQPIFYTGGGVINSGSHASKLLTKFVHKTTFPITNTLMGLGSFPASDSHFLGMLGMHGSLEANMCMAECDVMICVGARFDDRITGRLDGFSPNSKKIHIDIDPSSINKNVMVDIPIVGDVANVLEKMLALWEEGNYETDKGSLATWWRKIEKWRSKKSFNYEQTGDIILPQYAIDSLGKALQDRDYYVSTDVGQHQMWSAQFINFDLPNRWLTSGGLGTMGYGLPAAIGAQIAHPESTVVTVSGEASVLMNIQELATAMQYRLPVKLFIVNNGCMGMVRQWQDMFHGSRYSETYFNTVPDFALLAKSFGATGLNCNKASELEGVINEMLNTEGPVVANIIVEQTGNVFPMIPSGAAHNEVLMTSKNSFKEQEGNDSV